MFGGFVGSILGAVGVGTLVASTIGGISAAKKQNKALEQQNQARERLAKAQERRNQIAQRRERLRLINQGRKARASVISSASNRVGLGGLSGSGVQAGLALASNRLGGALGTQTALASSGQQITDISTDIARAGTAANRAATQGQMWSGIGSLGGSLINVSNSRFFQ